MISKSQFHLLCDSVKITKFPSRWKIKMKKALQRCLKTMLRPKSLSTPLPSNFSVVASVLLHFPPSQPVPTSHLISFPAFSLTWPIVLYLTHGEGPETSASWTRGQDHTVLRVSSAVSPTPEDTIVSNHGTFLFKWGDFKAPKIMGCPVGSAPGW